MSNKNKELCFDHVKACAVDWKFVSPSNSHFEILTPKVIVLGGGIFEWQLGHEVQTSWVILVLL